MSTVTVGAYKVLSVENEYYLMHIYLIKKRISLAISILNGTSSKTINKKMKQLIKNEDDVKKLKIKFDAVCVDEMNKQDEETKLFLFNLINNIDDNNKGE